MLEHRRLIGMLKTHASEKLDSTVGAVISHFYIRERILYIQFQNYAKNAKTSTFI